MRFSSDALRIRMARKVLHQYRAARPSSATSSLSSFTDDQYDQMEPRPDITSFLQPVQQYAAARQADPDPLLNLTALRPVPAPSHMEALPDEEGEEGEGEGEEGEEQEEEEEEGEAEEEEEEEEQEEEEGETLEALEEGEEEAEMELTLHNQGLEGEASGRHAGPEGEEQEVSDFLLPEEAGAAAGAEEQEEAEEAGQADIFVVQHRTPEQSMDNLMMQSMEVLAFAADNFIDDGQYIDYALDACVASLEPPFMDMVQPGTFTVAGWEIDRQLDDIIGGLDMGARDAVLYGSPMPSRHPAASSSGRASEEVSPRRPGSMGMGAHAASRLHSVTHGGGGSETDFTLVPHAVSELDSTATLVFQGSMASRANRSRVLSAHRTPPGGGQGQDVDPRTPRSGLTDWTAPNNERDGPVIDYMVDDLVQYVDQQYAPGQEQATVRGSRPGSVQQGQSGQGGGMQQSMSSKPLRV